MSFTGWQLRAAVRTLRAGGVIAYPTEAVYGLGCDPLSLRAVARLLEMKGRPAAKGLILIAAGRAQLDPYVEWNALSRAQLEPVLDSWPGPVTWLLPVRPGVPEWLHGGNPTVAVRVSAHPPVRELCLAFGGALVSTSANRAGKPPARSAFAVQRVFRWEVDRILAAPLGGEARPTEIRDGGTGRVIRPG